MTKNTFVILMQDADHCNKIVTSSLQIPDRRRQPTQGQTFSGSCSATVPFFFGILSFLKGRGMHLKRIHITPVEVQTKNTWHILGQPLPTNMGAGNLLSIK